jgi:hypothetical protein
MLNTAKESDLVEAISERRGNTGERRNFDMVRMFRRLMRTATRPRVVGNWQL